jgi:hypothetical protein
MRNGWLPILEGGTIRKRHRERGCRVILLTIFKKSLFEWKCPLLDKRFPHGEKIRIIDSQNFDRDAADTCPAAKRRSRPLEVFAPQAQAWIEESNDLPVFESVPSMFGSLCRLQ